MCRARVWRWQNCSYFTVLIAYTSSTTTSFRFSQYKTFSRCYSDIRYGQDTTNNTVIRELTLSGNPIGSAGAATLCNAMISKHVNIVHLDLSRCNIGDNCTSALAMLLQASRWIQFPIVTPDDRQLSERYYSLHWRRVLTKDIWLLWASSLSSEISHHRYRNRNSGALGSCSITIIYTLIQRYMELVQINHIFIWFIYLVHLVVMPQMLLRS